VSEKKIPTTWVKPLDRPTEQGTHSVFVMPPPLIGAPGNYAVEGDTLIALLLLAGFTPTSSEAIVD